VLNNSALIHDGDFVTKPKSFHAIMSYEPTPPKVGDCLVNDRGANVWNGFGAHYRFAIPFNSQ
jgi:hypothetical protein